MPWRLTSRSAGRIGRLGPVLPGHRAATLAAVLLACVTGCDGPPRPAAGGDEGTRSTAGIVAESPYRAPAGEGERSLREVLTSRALVGNRVRVTGRCLAPVGVQPLGQPPRPWNEWQLESEGVAMFVIGPMPGACLVPGQQVVLTIDALVAEDTLPAIGDLPGAPRRFLVLLGVEGGGERGGRGGG